MCHTTSLLLSGIGFIFLPSKEAHFCPFYKDFPSFVYAISHTPCLLSSSRCASRGQRERSVERFSGPFKPRCEPLIIDGVTRCESAFLEQEVTTKLGRPKPASTSDQ